MCVRFVSNEIEFVWREHINEFRRRQPKKNGCSAAIIIAGGPRTLCPSNRRDSLLDSAKVGTAKRRISTSAVRELAHTRAAGNSIRMWPEIVARLRHTAPGAHSTNELSAISQMECRCTSRHEKSIYKNAIRHLKEAERR